MSRNDIWTITAYFNPMRYRSRLTNYRTFRSRLTLPLVTVELAHEGTWELRDSDANLLIQIRGGDILWQKERLLSIALAAVPASCDKVVSIDCDVIFEPADPWQQVCEKLDHNVLVQPFKDALDLPFGWEGGSLAESRAARDCSIGYAVATGASSTRVLTPDLSRGHRPRWRPGLAVAFRRGVFERHDFYFGRVLGGNDRAILCAALGQYEALAYVHHLTARQQEHFCEWAKPFFGTARGRLGYADATIGHLWHGSIKNRNYGGRHQDLRDLEFDPYTDIAVEDNGSLRWNSDKPRLHRLAIEHFMNRREDEIRSVEGAAC